MHHSNWIQFLALVGLLFALLGCASPLSSPASATMTAPARPASPTSTRTPRPRNPVYPTPITPEHQGNDEKLECSGVGGSVLLPLSEVEGLSEDEIADRVVRLRLDAFHTPEISDYCRIEAYRIDKISAPEPWMLEGLNLPPRSFLRVVDFSIKLPQLGQYWFRFVNTGEIDLPDEYAGALANSNWLQTSMVLVVYEVDPGGDGDNVFYTAAQVKVNP